MRCLFDVRSLSEEHFGAKRDPVPEGSKPGVTGSLTKGVKTGQVRLRKAVLMTIASYADPDGTNAWPSMKTLSSECLACERSIRSAIAWLRDNSLLKVEPKGTGSRLNMYTIRVPKNAATQSAVSTEAPTGKMERSSGKMEQVMRQDDPINAAILVAADRPVPPSNTPTSYQPGPETKSKVSLGHDKIEAKELAERIAESVAYVSDGQFALNARQQHMLGAVAHEKGYTAKEVSICFKGFLQHLDQEDKFAVRYATKNFSEQAPALLSAARTKRQEREAEAQAVDATRKRMEEQAEAERAARQAEKDNEPEVEETLGGGPWR